MSLTTTDYHGQSHRTIIYVFGCLLSTLFLTNTFGKIVCIEHVNSNLAPTLVQLLWTKIGRLRERWENIREKYVNLIKYL